MWISRNRGKERKVFENRISIVVGDITKLSCDAIVNAANSTLLGGGGVDGAIHRAAGNKLLEECKTLGGCKTGEAKITGGYNLPAKHVIHTVGPIYGGRESDREKLASCYRNSLNIAAENGIRSIAFPSISTGAYRYPLMEASEIAMKTVKEWIEQHEEYIIEIVFCCFDRRTYDRYKELL